MDLENIVKERIRENIEVKQKIFTDEVLLKKIVNISKEMCSVIKNNGKILVCGNGGSASDSLHMAAEIVGRFQKERQAWPALALNADMASVTAIANDYGYADVFSRAVEAYMTKDDLLVGISTSGDSENVYRAILKAKQIGGKSVAFLGKDGGKISKEVDLEFVVPSNVTARIQESHILIIHILCELMEEIMVDE